MATLAKVVHSEREEEEEQEEEVEEEEEEEEKERDSSDKLEREDATKSDALAARHAERLKRLKELHARRVSGNINVVLEQFGRSSYQNEARKLNHKEVVEEDRRKKLPANWESRKKKAEWEIAAEESRKVCSLSLILFLIS